MSKPWRRRAFKTIVGAKEPRPHLWVVLTEPREGFPALLVDLTEAGIADPDDLCISAKRRVTYGVQPEYPVTKRSCLVPDYWEAVEEERLERLFNHSEDFGWARDEFFEWCIAAALKYREDADGPEVQRVIDSLQNDPDT